MVRNVHSVHPDRQTPEDRDQSDGDEHGDEEGGEINHEFVKWVSG